MLRGILLIPLGGGCRGLIHERGFGTKRFVDAVIISATGGNGGNGSMSFEGKMRGKESPDGGHGGRGGDVIFVAKEGLRDLSHINSFHLRGKDGKHGSGQGKSGKRGKDIIITVPVGTQVLNAPLSQKVVKRLLDDTTNDDDEDEEEEDMDENGSEEEEEEDDDDDEEEGLVTNEEAAERANKQNTSVKRFIHKKQRLLMDLDQDGKQFIVARGGFPGKGNILQSTLAHDFYLHLKPEERVGKEGTSTRVELRLKLIADCALVGFPNAGKSSLLGALTSSRPPVAAYAFTTLHPYLGMLEFTDMKRIVIADLPGLVDGAALENRGMGHRFLRHVERTKVLIYVLDGAPEPHERDDFSSCVEDFRKLQAELEYFQRDLTRNRPKMVVITKSDRPDAQVNFNAQRDLIRQEFLREDPLGGEPYIFSVCARDGTGLMELANTIRRTVEMVELQEAELAEPAVEVFKMHNPIPRIPRGVVARKPLLLRIKWREVTHQDCKVWRTTRRSDRNMGKMKPKQVEDQRRLRLSLPYSPSMIK